MVSWKGGNIVVDLLDPLFSRRLARLRDIAIDLICGVILFWPAIRVWELAERSRQYGDVTEYLNFPQYHVAAIHRRVHPTDRRDLHRAAASRER